MNTTGTLEQREHFHSKQSDQVTGPTTHLVRFYYITSGLCYPITGPTTVHYFRFLYPLTGLTTPLPVLLSFYRTNYTPLPVLLSSYRTNYTSSGCAILLQDQLYTTSGSAILLQDQLSHFWCCFYYRTN